MKIDFNNCERDILIYAFRYTLGRATYSVSTVVDLLHHNWGNLSSADKELYKREIKEAIDMEQYGMQMDKNAWETILYKE